MRDGSVDSGSAASDFGRPAGRDLDGNGDLRADGNAAIAGDGADAGGCELSEMTIDGLRE